MRLTLFLFICAAIAAACNMKDPGVVTVKGQVITDTASRPTSKGLEVFVDTLQLARIKVLENGTVTYVLLDWMERASLRVGDTVWVDLATHMINDTCSTAMKAKLLMRID